MILHTYTIKLKNYRSSWRLRPLGDIHYSNIGCDRKKLNSVIEEIKSSETDYWIGMGDYDEYIGFTDPRFSAGSIAKEEKINEWKFWTQRQTKQIANILSPIKDKCIGLLWGNHEKNIAQRYYYDPVSDLAERLNAKHLGYECLVRVFVLGNDDRGRYSIVIYAHHGFGGGKLPGGNANNLQRLGIHYNADIYLFGHVHRMLTLKEVRLGISSRGSFTSKPVLFVSTGSCLKLKQEGVEGYEVKPGYPPTAIGFPYVEISGDSQNNLNFKAVLD